MMKKVMMGAIAALTMLATFASCSDDQKISMDMSGEWEGDFGSYVRVKGEYYDATHTYLRFDPDHDYATHGTGVQVDHFGRECPYSRLYTDFDWDVDDERIYITYEDGYNVSIRHYTINRYHFTGRVDGSFFDLSKLSSYYDWSPSTHDHSVHVYIGTRAASDSAEVAIEERGCRFKLR